MVTKLAEVVDRAESRIMVLSCAFSYLASARAAGSNCIPALAETDPRCEH